MVGNSLNSIKPEEMNPYYWYLLKNIINFSPNVE